MSQFMSPQEVKSFLKKQGVYTKKKWGQNFLTCETTIQKIIEAAEISDDDVIWEIGPGMGHLTQYLIAEAPQVFAVEVDPDMVGILNTRFADCPQLEIYQGDVLEKKHLNPKIVDKIKQFQQNGKKIKVVANLPYNIATPIIMSLLQQEGLVERIIITIQKEVADRIDATPNCKDYGILSIWSQLQAKTKFIHQIPPDAFYPPPKVTSAVIGIYPKAHALGSSVTCYNTFDSVLRYAFQMRRKTILNSLKKMEKEFPIKVREILEKANISPELRAGTLTIENYIKIANIIAEQQNLV